VARVSLSRPGRRAVMFHDTRPRHDHPRPTDYRRVERTKRDRPISAIGAGAKELPPPKGGALGGAMTGLGDGSIRGGAKDRASQEVAWPKVVWDGGTPLIRPGMAIGSGFGLWAIIGGLWFRRNVDRMGHGNGHPLPHRPHLFSKVVSSAARQSR
jgi:hypothetical protein